MMLKMPLTNSSSMRITGSKGSAPSGSSSAYQLPWDLQTSYPSSIDRLVNLRNFDLDLNDSFMPQTIWKLDGLKYLSCLYGEISSRFNLRKLGAEKLTNLQALDLKPGRWLEGDGLGKLTQLKKFSLRGEFNPYLKQGFFECVANLTALQTLILLNSESTKNKPLIEEKTLIPGLMPFSCHANLCKVALRRKLELPDQIEFYHPSLMKLSLEQCKLKNDPMPILEKLPSFRVLTLSFLSYIGKKLACSSKGFVQLQSLKLCGLFSLEKIIIEEGRMPLLKVLQVESCANMKRLPRHLLKLKNLEKVEPKSMFDQLLGDTDETESVSSDSV